MQKDVMLVATVVSVSSFCVMTLLNDLTNWLEVGIALTIFSDGI